MNCSICCETFNKSNRILVQCCYCSYTSCRACIQVYLISTVNDPHCMNCKRVWNREFIDLSCTKFFRNKELKEHRENILFDREKNLLPETQPYVVHQKQVTTHNDAIAKLYTYIKNCKNKINEHQVALYGLRGFVPSSSEPEQKQFVHKCPVTECKGFLSTKWHCALCDNTICKDCNEIVDKDHQCDPGSVETMNLIKKDTKLIYN